MSRTIPFVLSALCAAAFVAGCGGSGSDQGGATSTTTGGASKTSTASTIRLNGAGSTFDNPLFAKAFPAYQQSHSQVSVNYQSVGSGAGIGQFTAGTVDFGATDVPMNKGELSKAEARGGAVIQVPVALGAVAMAYNIPGAPPSVRLSPKALADIYLGTVKTWGDPEITAANGGHKLPDSPITVAHRADGSGTTYIFTDYLSKISPQWKSGPGTGKAVKWPVGVGGKGTDGVAGIVSKTPGAIGYVELSYALETHMPSAMLQNSAGQFVSPTIDAARAAAATVPSVSPSNFSIVNAGGAGSYPIAGYSWVVLFQKQPDAAKGKALQDLLKWMVTGAQDTIVGSLNYVPLPKNVQSAATSTLNTVKF